MSKGRDILLKAAFTKFVMHGYDGTGVAAILDGTGLTKGAFYHHFASKEALFAEVIRRYFPMPFGGIDLEALGTSSAKAQATAITGFYRQVARDTVASGVDINRYFTLFFDALARLPAFRSEISSVYERVMQAMTQALIREGVSEAVATAEAKAFVARYEGELFMWSVTGSTPSFLAEEE